MGRVGIESAKTTVNSSLAKAGAMADSTVYNYKNSSALNLLKNSAETQVSIDRKLVDYLLNKKHPVGASKEEWFDSALGFNQGNSKELQNK